LEIKVTDENLPIHFNPPSIEPLYLLIINMGEPPLGGPFTFLQSSHMMYVVSGSSNVGGTILSSPNVSGGVTFHTFIPPIRWIFTLVSMSQTLSTPIWGTHLVKKYTTPLGMPIFSMPTLTTLFPTSKFHIQCIANPYLQYW